MTEKTVKTETEEKPSPVLDVTPNSANASIDLFSPVLDENGNVLGTTRVIVRQSAELAGVALELLMSQMDHFVALGFSPIAPQTRPMPGSQAPSAIAPNVPGSVTAPSGIPAPSGTAPLPPGQVPPAAGQQEEEGTWRIDYFTVTPIAGGFTRVEFFETNGRNPKLKINKWKTETVAELFRTGTGQDWVVGHFQVVQTYNIPLSVSWKLGRPTGYNDTRYRDVVAVSLPN